MKTTVIYHSADFDGLFCREIVRKFLPDAQFIGWDFGDPPIDLTVYNPDFLYVLDLPLDKPFGCTFVKDHPVPDKENYASTAALALLITDKQVIWIDHHKTAIESHPKDVPGYRIEGVAACRLAYQWFIMVDGNTSFGWDKAPDGIRRAGVLPMIQDYKTREVNEPEAVRLAGEHDIWDHRDPRTVLFQLGLNSKQLTEEDWKWLLTTHEEAHGELENNKRNLAVIELVANGRVIQPYLQNADAQAMNNAFIMEWEGLKFLTINTTAKGSLQFASLDVPAAGHDALLKFHFNGHAWEISMYHSAHRKSLDLSGIAKKHGGGGHPGACGFVTNMLPFPPM